MFCDKKHSDCRDDFREIIDYLYSDQSCVIFTCYYSHLNLFKSTLNTEKVPVNLHFTKCCDSTIDFDSSVLEVSFLKKP